MLFSGNNASYVDSINQIIETTALCLCRKEKKSCQNVNKIQKQTFESSMVWVCIFGGAALHLPNNSYKTILEPEFHTCGSHVVHPIAELTPDKVLQYHVVSGKKSTRELMGEASLES